MIGLQIDPAAFIAARIVERYSHPSRTNYLYLFHVQSSADFQPIPPVAGQIIQAWVDEENTLSSIDPIKACHLCQLTADRWRSQSVVDGYAPPRSREERRRLMARQVVFSITPPDPAGEPVALVDLFSRAIAFTPKGDRRVTETWRPFAGGWFSAYKPPD